MNTALSLFFGNSECGGKWTEIPLTIYHLICARIDKCAGCYGSPDEIKTLLSVVCSHKGEVIKCLV